MRLGLLGPANNDMVGLARAAQRLVDEAGAEKVLYLGSDGALDRVVASWAHEIVGANPHEDVIFERAAVRCARALPDAIDDFVEDERSRLRLQVFASLPGSTARTIEILDARVAVLVYDKAMLDEDDIAAAHLIVFGKSTEPMLRKVGVRTFFAPGSIGSANGGAALLDDGIGGGIRIDVFGPDGKVRSREEIGNPKHAGKLRVQGSV